MSVMQSYPQPYIDFLAEYHGSRDFFHCHDIMEEYWKDQAGTRYTGCWLVFVRISVAVYHARRGNWIGARKLMAKSVEETDPGLMSELGLDGPELAKRLRETYEEWNRTDRPFYRDIDLPIAEPQLAEAAARTCAGKGWTWCLPLEQVNPDIVQKHITRDRTPVVEARRLSAESKRQSRRQ